ncbi:hypothetical protein J5N97_019561 [Dioscorea zingiberensis]|uniref:Uncharacterized protein n=1 Tax=Dioscorea zingiberensis TaxID=325984 RepID=A0A9D5CE34_9LILI|nr:hypothetical protein J5N97_019561 [Dioscorea zingiberensis]
MIKRRFFKQDHGEKSASDSSSSSDSSPEPSKEEELDGDDDAIGRAEDEEVEKPPSPSPGSGYETEDSSANGSEDDSSGLLSNVNEDSSGSPQKNQLDIGVHAEEKDEKVSKVGGRPCDPNDPIQAELANCILKCKSVFKCRLCPRIILLNDNTVRTHLSSKRHARSKKLLGEGRLKLMLNSDGEIEEEQETHAERHARTLALAQELDVLPKKDKAHLRKRQRRKNDNGSRQPKKKEGKKKDRNCD